MSKIRDARKALGMNARQLSERLGVSPAAVSQLEKAEENGQITVNKMHQVAEAMGLKFVYKIEPVDK